MRVLINNDAISDTLQNDFIRKMYENKNDFFESRIPVTDTNTVTI